MSSEKTLFMNCETLFHGPAFSFFMMVFM